MHIANAALSLLNHENDKSEFTEVKTALKGGSKPKVGYSIVLVSNLTG